MRQDNTTGGLDPQIQALLNAAMSEPAAPPASDEKPQQAVTTVPPAKPKADPAQAKAAPAKPKAAPAQEKGAAKGATDKGKAAAQPQPAGGKREKSLADVIREQASEVDLRPIASLSLKKILGGDILATSAMKRQVGVILLIMAFMMVYISDRYSCQQSLIRIDHLNQELNDAKYKALSSNSQLTEKSRESRVLEMLQNCKDSTLHIATQPPYIIQVPEE